MNCLRLPEKCWEWGCKVCFPPKMDDDGGMLRPMPLPPVKSPNVKQVQEEEFA